MPKLAVQYVSVHRPELADRLLSGELTMLVKSRPFTEFTHKPVLLVSPAGAHGKVYLSKPTPISIREFRELQGKHGLTDDDRLLLWPGARELFAFTVVVIERFDHVLRLRLPRPLPAVGDEVEFVDEPPVGISVAVDMGQSTSAPWPPEQAGCACDPSAVDPTLPPSRIQEIRDIRSYDPQRATVEQQKDDWRLLIAHYARHLAGRRTSWPKSVIEEKAVELAKCLAKNGVVFHPDQMTAAGRALFTKVLAEEPTLPHTLTDEELAVHIAELRKWPLAQLVAFHTNLHLTWAARGADEQVANLHEAVAELLKRRGHSVSCPDDGLAQALHEATAAQASTPAFSKPVQLVYIADAVSLVGSAVYSLYSSQKPHDIDILFRTEPNFWLAARIARCISPTLGLHVLQQTDGPSWDYVPIGDFVLASAAPAGYVEESDIPGLETLRPVLLEEGFVRIGDDGSLHINTFPNEGLTLKLERLFQMPVRYFSEDGLPALDLWFVPHRQIRLRYLENDVSVHSWLSASLRSAFEPGRPFQPLKAKGGYHIGEFYSIDDAILFWATPARLKEGVLVEPKVDGIRLVLHKDGERVWIFTEDRKRNRADVLVPLRDSVSALPVQSCILDAEVVEYEEEGVPAPRHTMVELVVSKSPPKRPLIAWVHDCLYLDGADLSQEPAVKRISEAHRLLGDRKGILRPMPFRVVNTVEALKEAFKWASEFSEGASEGAMLKEANSTYVPGNTEAWAKVKLVREIKVKVIGRMRKANPWPVKPRKELRGAEAIQAYRRLAADSKTYLVRGAILKGGQLVPIEAKRVLTPGDLELRWTGGEWRGLECPELWEMAPGWEHRAAGELAYGTTYARAFEERPVQLGDIVTVRPMEMQIFEHGGSEHVSWMFPILQEVDPTRTQPDTWEDVRRIVDFTRSRHGVPSRAQAGVEFTAGIRVPLTRDEARVATKKALGYDWYVVRQPPKKLVRFVLQRHVRGVLDPAQAEEARKLLRHEDSQQVMKRFGLYRLKEPLHEVTKALQQADDERRELSGELFLTQEPGDGPVYAWGNCHADLRIFHPSEDFLVGWTCDVVKIVLQPLDSPEDLIFLLRDRILENQPRDQWLAQQKLSQPPVWFEIVSRKRPLLWRPPSTVGATSRSGACFVYVASGHAVYGVQKSEHYHEYFLRFDDVADGVPHSDELDGRWDFKYIPGEYEKTGGDWFWQGSRPWVTQVPYVLTHDYETEAEKERKAKRQWEWNGSSVEASELLLGKKWWLKDEEKDSD